MKPRYIFLVIVFLYSIFTNLHAQDVELHIQMGHTAQITTLAFSPDEKYLLSGSLDGTVKLWEISTLREIRSFDGHLNAVSSVCFHPDGLKMASSSYDKTIIIWDLLTGKKIKTLRHKLGVTSVQFNNKGDQILSASDKVYLWDLSTGKNTNILENPRTRYLYPGITRAIYNDDNSLVACLSFHGLVTTWDTKTWQQKAEYSIDGDTELNAITVYAATIEGTEYINTMKSDTKGMKGIDKSRIQEALKNNKSFLNTASDLSGNWSFLANSCLMFTPDKKHIIAGQWIISKIDLENKTITNLDDYGFDKLKHIKSGVTSFVEAPLPIFTSISYNTKEQSLYTTKNKQLQSINLKNSATKINHEIEKGEIISRQILSKNNQTIVCGFESGDIGIYKIKNNKMNLYGKLISYSNPVGSSAISHNDSLIAIGMNSRDKSIRIWDLVKAKEEYQISIDRTNRQKIKSLEYQKFYSDFLLVGIDSLPRMGSLGERGGSGNVIVLYKLVPYINYRLKDGVGAAAFCPKPGVFATGGGGFNLFQVDFINRKQLSALPGHRNWITSVCYHPNGDNIITGGYYPKNIDAYKLGGEIKVWHSKRDSSLFGFHVPDSAGVYSIDVNADGVIAAGGNKNIFVYNVKLKTMQTFRGHYGKINSIDMSPDDKSFVSGSDDQTVRIWKLSPYSYKIKHLHSAPVTSVKYSYSGKYILSSSKDGTTKLLNTKDGGEIVSFIATQYSSLNNRGKETFLRSSICVTPDYYYLYPKGKPAGLYFVKGLKSYSFEQFDLRYNRPDIVLKRIDLASQELIDAYHKAYLKRLEKMNFTLEMLSSEWHVPEIQILNKSQIKRKTNQKELTINIKANDTKYKLDRLNVWVNNIPVYGKNGINLRGMAKRGVSKNLKIPLNKGENKIDVSVLNQVGTESFKQSVFVEYTTGKITKPNLYIISIGVSEYTNSNYNLNYATKDANDLVKEFLKKKDKFNEIKTFKILNKEATSKNIKALKKTLQQSNIEDEVVVFFAGHGLLDGNLDYYLATYNTNFSNPSKNGLPYEELENLLDGIPARRKLLLIDACHSGEVDKEEIGQTQKVIASVNNKTNIVYRGVTPLGGKQTKTKIGLKNSFELMQELFADLRRGTGAMVISSAGGGEFAFEGEQWKNGVFTYSIIQALRNKESDFNNDGILQVSELQDYVQAMVKQLTNGKQNPTSRRVNLEFDFGVY